MAQQKKVALITGGTRGIGKAIALYLLSKDFKVIYTGTSSNSIEKGSADFSAYGDKAIPVVCNVTSTTEIANLKKQVEAQGQLDVLVNNAGVFTPDTFADGKEEVLRELMEINLFGTYNVSQALLPSMLKTKRSHIFNICSIAGKDAYPNGCSYSISKFAMDGLGKSMRLELMDKGIRVSNVYPGATYTDSWAASDLPESRFIQASDIAKSIWNAYEINEFSDVEEIVIRPILGDI